MQTDAHPTADAGPSGHITYLPSSTQSQLRSTQILTSLPQIISELVQNSLDAGAHSVDVTLDPTEWECSVRDDGAGISRDGLTILSGGSQGGRYGRPLGAIASYHAVADVLHRDLEDLYARVLGRSDHLRVSG